MWHLLEPPHPMRGVHGMAQEDRRGEPRLPRRDLYGHIMRRRLCQYRREYPFSVGLTNITLG